MEVELTIARYSGIQKNGEPLPEGHLFESVWLHELCTDWRPLGLKTWEWLEDGRVDEEECDNPNCQYQEYYNGDEMDRDD